jgi:sulfatase maturation enzyme AslB (radical SAM superfamily)
MERQKPWFDTKRQILGKVIPLNTPLSITLTPSSICNFKCNYCMQAANRHVITSKGFKIEIMPWKTFLLCVDQIGKFPQKLKKIEFYGMGEPLCNPRLSEMVSHVKTADICNTISVMTNGSLLTHQLSDNLIAAGTDEIRISLQGLSSEKYSEIAGVNVDFEHLINEISYLHSIKGSCNLYVKIIESALTSKDKRYGRIKKIFKNISDSYSIEGLLPLFNDVNYPETMNNRNTNKIKTRYGYSSTSRHICQFQFYRFIVLTDGRVTACCDPLNAIYWGSIHNIKLIDMWNSSKRLKLLDLQLKRKSYKNTLCRRCYMPNDIYSDSDDLEPYADELLKRMN